MLLKQHLLETDSLVYHQGQQFRHVTLYALEAWVTGKRTTTKTTITTGITTSISAHQFIGRMRSTPGTGGVRLQVARKPNVVSRFRGVQIKVPTQKNDTLASVNF